VIVQDGLPTNVSGGRRQLLITRALQRKLRAAADARGAAEGIIKGHLQAARRRRQPKAHLLASGPMVNEALPRPADLPNSTIFKPTSGA